MKLFYDAESDSLYIELRGVPGADAREISRGVVADFDSEGNLVGLDIEYASVKLDLRKLEVEALPMLEKKPA